MPECHTQGQSTDGFTYTTCSAQEYATYLSRVVREGEANGTLSFFPNAPVVDITDAPEQIKHQLARHYEIHVQGGAVFRARQIVLATGKFSVPRTLAAVERRGSMPHRVVPSMSLRKSRVLQSATTAAGSAFGQRIMVVGGGVTAMEISVGLLDMERSPVEQVTLCYRGSQPKGGHNHPSARLLYALNKHVNSERLLLRLDSEVQWLNGTHVGLVYHGRAQFEGAVSTRTFSVQVDAVVEALGYTPNASFFADVARVEMWPDGTPLAGQPVLRRRHLEILDDEHSTKDNWQRSKASRRVVVEHEQWGETSRKNMHVLLSDGTKVDSQGAFVTAYFEGCALEGMGAATVNTKWRGAATLAVQLAQDLCADARLRVAEVGASESFLRELERVETDDVLQIAIVGSETRFVPPEQQAQIVADGLHRAFEACPLCSPSDAARELIARGYEQFDGTKPRASPNHHRTGVVLYLSRYETMDLRPLLRYILQISVQQAHTLSWRQGPPLEDLRPLEVMSIGVDWYTLQLEHQARAWAHQLGRTMRYVTVETQEDKATLLGARHGAALHMDARQLGLDSTTAVPLGSIDVIVSFGIFTPAQESIEGFVDDIMSAFRRVLRDNGVLILHAHSKWGPCLSRGLRPNVSTVKVWAEDDTYRYQRHQKELNCSVAQNIQRLIDEAHALDFVKGAEQGLFAGFRRVRSQLGYNFRNRALELMGLTDMFVVQRTLNTPCNMCAKKGAGGVSLS